MAHGDACMIRNRSKNRVLGVSARPPCPSQHQEALEVLLDIDLTRQSWPKRTDTGMKLCKSWEGRDICWSRFRSYVSLLEAICCCIEQKHYLKSFGVS